jgi:hypothetical protein
MIALGIDPPNAWAVVDGRDRILGSGHWSKGLPDADLARRIADGVAAARALGAECCAIEGQWIEWRDSVPATERRGKARSSLILARSAGMWVQAWHIGGPGRLVSVAPNVWRQAVLVRGGSPTRDDRKAQAVMMARFIYGAALQEDEAEAVGIARWATHAEVWRDNETK